MTTSNVIVHDEERVLISTLGNGTINQQWFTHDEALLLARQIHDALEDADVQD